MKVLVINGPNLNMLGIREPGIYGSDNYDRLVQICQEAGAAQDFDEVEVFQSNHEGSIVDKIQEAYGKVDGIVINPAAYTHTSVAILDALKAVAIPAVEVHISAVETREDFRQVSYARLACFATITGEGLQGYAHALELLKERLEKKPREQIHQRDSHANNASAASSNLTTGGTLLLAYNRCSHKTSGDAHVKHPSGRLPPFHLRYRNLF